MVGCGGIGSTVISYLGAAGVPLVVCDHDQVELNNLHRQILHDRTQLGINKALSAQTRMKVLNPDVCVEAITLKVVEGNVHDLVKGVDVVVDATDNYIVRYLINDACMKEGKVLVSGSAVGMEGQISVFIPGKGPCYRCLYPNHHPWHHAGAAQMLVCLSCPWYDRVLAGYRNDQGTTSGWAGPNRSLERLAWPATYLRRYEGHILHL